MVDMAKAKESKRAAATRGYAVRPATRDDLKAILGLYNWAVNQTFATIDSEPLDAEEAQAWWERAGARGLSGVGGRVDDPHHAHCPPLPHHRRRARVLPFVERSRPGELHASAVDAVAGGDVDFERGGANRLGRDRAVDVRQDVV